MARPTNKQINDNGHKASSRKEKSQAPSKDGMPPHHDIPKFDLAEQILAEQRKLSSVRRKGPGKKAVRSMPVRASNEKPKPPKADHYEQSLIPSEQERIIAEIVARDIQNLLLRNQENG